MLKSVHIQRYKSLSNVNIEFSSPILVLVGLNAAGKSNVIDAIRFVRDALIDGLDHAISSRGGIHLIRQYSPTKPYQISIKLNFDNEYGDAYYALKLASLRDGNFKIESEEINFYELDSTPKLDENENQIGWNEEAICHKTLSRDSKGNISLKDSLIDHVFSGFSDSETNKAHEEQLAFAMYRFHFGSLFNSITQLRFLSLYPNVLREPSRPERDALLKESGQNWASVLKAMKKTEKGKRSFQRLLEMMQLVMPTLQDITVKGVGGYLVPQFLVKEQAASHPHYFDPSQLSDGTLRVFGILLALNQTPAPKFLAIEEPEQTINPGVLGMLSDAFKEASQSTQLIITSHSPNLVDYFSPDELRVVATDDGETIVSPIRKTQIESIKEHLTSIQELMMLEGLQPELLND